MRFARNLVLAVAKPDRKRQRMRMLLYTSHPERTAVVAARLFP
jgi:hypothetical protein